MLPHDDIPDGDLRGKVLVEWTLEDQFIYRHTGNTKPLKFKPSFMTAYIEPEDIYTDGG